MFYWSACVSVKHNQSGFVTILFVIFVLQWIFLKKNKCCGKSRRIVFYSSANKSSPFWSFPRMKTTKLDWYQISFLFKLDFLFIFDIRFLSCLYFIHQNGVSPSYKLKHGCPYYQPTRADLWKLLYSLGYLDIIMALCEKKNLIKCFPADFFCWSCFTM